MATTYANEFDQLAAEAMVPAAEPPRVYTYFGEVITVDLWACVLESGKGKVLFDPGTHEASRKRIAVRIQIECLKADGTPYTVDQEVITTAKEWRDYTLPSLARLGLTLPQLKGAWVKAKRQPTGEKFTKRDGSQGDKQALVFEAIYPDQLTMKTAADALYTKATVAPDAQAVADAAAGIRKTPDVAPTQAPMATAPSIDRATLANFLPFLWNSAAGDKYAFLAKVRAMPDMAPFHDVNAPEMRAILGDDFDEIPF